jgi:hypothetical protein
MKESQYGPCGLYCGACGAEDCGGCRSDIIDEYVKCCKFRVCARENDLDFCCFCSEYPCRELKEFTRDEWPHHWTMEPNLQFIKENGLKKWLESQKQEWSCRSCGKAIYWYQKKCGCGLPLKAWAVPEFEE